MCENIYEFSLSFVVEYVESNVTKTIRVQVASTSGSNSVDDFRLRGDGIRIDGADNEVYASGTVVAADLSLTVINDSALEILRNSSLQETNKNRLLEQNSFHFSKTIILPRP